MWASVSPSFDQHRDGRADLARSSRGEQDPADDPRLLGAVLDDRFSVSISASGVADGDRVAGGDQPGGDGGLPVAPARRSACG